MSRTFLVSEKRNQSNCLVILKTKKTNRSNILPKAEVLTITQPKAKPTRKWIEERLAVAQFDGGFRAAFRVAHVAGENLRQARPKCHHKID